MNDDVGFRPNNIRFVLSCHAVVRVLKNVCYARGSVDLKRYRTATAKESFLPQATKKARAKAI